MISAHIWNSPARLILPEGTDTTSIACFTVAGTVLVLVRYTMLELPECLRPGVKIAFADTCWGPEAIRNAHTQLVASGCRSQLREL